MLSLIVALSLAQAPKAAGLAGGFSGGIAHAKDAAAYRILGGKGTAALLVNQAWGPVDASVTRLVLEPGAEVAEHAHEQSAEILYVVSGKVEMRLGDGPASQAGAGDAIYIPAGVKHSARA